jgi:integrase
LNKAETLRPTFQSYLAGLAEPLAPATVKKVLQISQRFFRWAKQAHPREFRTVAERWIETLRPSRTPENAREHTYVTLEETLQLARVQVETGDLALRRDRAAAALLFLSGMRAGALGSLPIEAVDMEHRTIRQWPGLGVHTKNLKSATTYLLPIPELIEVAEAWDKYIRRELPPTAMWYTLVIGHWSEQTLSAGRPGTNRNVAIGKRLRKLFDLAGLRAKSPHKFRHGHAVWALQHASTMADYKAVSQNLMHSDVRITDSIYAPLLTSEVQQRITGLSNGAITGQMAQQPLKMNRSNAEVAEALRALANELAPGR